MTRKAAVFLAAIAAMPGTVASDVVVPRTPVLVELFTSEGCSSCPPADALLARLIEDQPVPGARIIALGEHVDYWDELGWKDPFSSAVFSRRQASYARRVASSGPYTPQLVAGGRFQAVGSNAAAARGAIAAAARSTTGSIKLGISSRGSAAVLDVDAHWDGAGNADVVLALVQERATTAVEHGENAGRILTHVAVVRSMSALGSGPGTFSGRLALERFRELHATRAVVFIQERGGGPVLAVESIDIP